MKNKLTENLIDAFKSVIPIAIVIMIVSLIIKLPSDLIMSFAISSVLLILGIALFTTGADMSMITIGETIGNSLVKRGNKSLILLVSLIIGIVITISEPDLMVLASELSSMPSYLTIGLVSLGVGVFLLIGVFRILRKISYRTVVTITLLAILILLYYTQPEFVSIAFDGGGVTTGPMGVPLIVAFGYGITKIRSDKDAKSDTFGLCGLSSLGPIVIILFLGLFFKTDSHFNIDNFTTSLSISERFITSFLSSIKEVSVSLLPIIGVFIVSQIIGKKINKNGFIKIFFGMILTILGLSIFLTGVSASFLETGYRIGNIISSSEYKYLLIPISMIMGYIIINAEPAVKILNKQISDLTEGSISEKMINLCLSLGVSLAIGLSLLRVFFQIPMIYVVMPGYFMAGMLMYFTPNIFTTVAYDSGGAASGALTTSFLLPICIGACVSLGGNILSDAFGVGSLVSLTPIITIQVLGIIYEHKLKVKENKVYNEEIVEYAWEG